MEGIAAPLTHSRYAAPLVLFALLWFGNAIVKWYPFVFDRVEVPGSESGGLQDLFRYINSVFLCVGFVALTLNRRARACVPWPELFYTTVSLLLLLVRPQPLFELRSTVPLAFLVVTPFWLGRTLGHEDRYRAALIGYCANLLSAVLLAGLAIWVVIPGTGDWAGLTGGRSYVFFTQFLGAVNAFILMNAIDLPQARALRLFRKFMLVVSLTLTGMSLTRSEFIPTALVCVALVTIRPIWWIPLAGAAAYVLYADQSLAYALRFASDDPNADLSTGRTALVEYLWNTFLAHPWTGIGRTLAGELAHLDVVEKLHGGGTEHGFIMHLAASGIAGGVYVATLIGRCVQTVWRVQLRPDWPHTPRATRVLLSSSASFAAGAILYGATGGFAAGSSFTDMAYLLFLGFTYGVGESAAAGGMPPVPRRPDAANGFEQRRRGRARRSERSASSSSLDLERKPPSLL